METETTTDPAPTEGAAPPAQPEAAASDGGTTPVTDPTSTPPAPASPAADDPAPAAKSEEGEDFTEDWLKSKGLDPNDPEAFQKAARMAFNSEKKMTQTNQKASELKKQLGSQPVEVDTDNPLVKDLAERVVQTERKQAVDDFTREVNLTTEQEQTMAKYLTDHPEKVAMVNEGFLSLKDVYNLSGAAGTSAAAAKEQGGKEALETLRNKQLASAPSGNATTSTPQKEVDPIAAALAD